MLDHVKELEKQGYEYEAAEGSLALLVSQALKHREPSLCCGDVSRFHAARHPGIHL